MSELPTADKIGMYVGGGLVVLGVLVIGILDLVLGAGHPVDGEGAIVHEAIIPLDIRAYIILLGLVIWGLVAAYNLVGGQAASEPAGTTEPGAAD